MKAFFLATISIIVLTQPAYASCPSYFLYPGVCLDPGHGGPDACKWEDMSVPTCGGKAINTLLDIRSITMCLAAQPQ